MWLDHYHTVAANVKSDIRSSADGMTMTVRKSVAVGASSFELIPGCWSEGKHKNVIALATISRIAQAVGTAHPIR